jgi:hypothetical protein
MRQLNGSFEKKSLAILMRQKSEWDDTGGRMIAMASLKNRFKHFFKDPKHLFPFVGALIVFLTFVMKEGLWEHWRETAQTLDTAQYMYELQQQSSTITQQGLSITDILLTRKSLLEATEDKRPPGLPEITYLRPTYLSWYSDLLRDADTTLHNISLVADKLPKRAPNVQKLSTFNVEVIKAKEEMERTEHHQLFVDMVEEELQHRRVKLEKAYPIEDKAFLNSPPWQYKSAEHLAAIGAYQGNDPYIRRTVSFAGSVYEFAHDTRRLAEQLFVDADAVRKRNKELSEYAWWASTILFALGWSLGLLGLLYGVPAAAGE